MFKMVVLVVVLCLFPVIAHAQSEEPQQRIYTGVGLIVTGAVVCAPLSIYLVVGEVPGGAAPAVVVGSIGVVGIVAGIIEIAIGANQHRDLMRERLTFTGDGLRVRF